MRIIVGRILGLPVGEIKSGQMFRLLGEDYAIYVMTNHRDVVNICNGEISDSADYAGYRAELLENVEILIK